jgi:hypothetical protein
MWMIRWLVSGRPSKRFAGSDLGTYRASKLLSKHRRKYEAYESIHDSGDGMYSAIPQAHLTRLITAS